MRHECLILVDRPGALVELCGISVIERLLRTLQRCGLTRAIILSVAPDVKQHLASPSPHRAKVALDFRSGSLIDVWPETADNVLVLLGDFVFDSRLLQLLDGRNSTAALVDSAVPEKLAPLVSSAPKTSRGYFCGAALLSRDWVATHDGRIAESMHEAVEKGDIEALDVASHDWYLPQSRRDLRAYWFPAPNSQQRKLAKDVLLDAAQKGTLDFPALVHAPIETFLVSHLCRTSISPNQLTIFSNIVAWSATVLFVTGHIGSGTALALAVGVLDGLDGKQARVKVETSKIGKLEHFADAFFENSWWIALAYYFQKSGQLPNAFLLVLSMLGAEAVAGLVRLSILRSCGRSIDDLSPFDRFVRLIGARRNINIWILAAGVLLGAQAKAFVVIVAWEIITMTIQLLRATWTLFFRSRATA